MKKENYLKKIDEVIANGKYKADWGMLNIGPKPDGTITDEETKVLQELGAWLNINGEGIYSTTFWKQFGEGKIFCRKRTSRFHC